MEQLDTNFKAHPKILHEPTEPELELLLLDIEQYT